MKKNLVTGVLLLIGFTGLNAETGTEENYEFENCHAVACQFVEWYEDNGFSHWSAEQAYDAAFNHCANQQ